MCFIKFKVVKQVALKIKVAAVKVTKYKIGIEFAR
jgi:hypothetical protein